MDSLNKSFSLISKLLNYSDFKSDNIYQDAIIEILKLYSNSNNKTCAIFFIENSYCSLKAGYNNKRKLKSFDFDNKYFSQLLENKSESLVFHNIKNQLCYKNTFIAKLAIRKSVFGFLLFSTDIEFDKCQISKLNAFADTISYKIRDYELNEVFKMQLKAMQDAVIEKEEAYEIVKKQHKKLQELDKTKNLFLANISHDLRTPLNAIIGFSQALDSKIFGDLNEKQSEYIKDIQISGLHLLGMINEILDISKLEANAMKFSPSDINAHQSISEVVNILEPLYKNKNISVEYNSEYKGNIFADYQKFQQILYNLLSNAIKFTQNGGKIIINSYSKDKNYYLEIKDNGIGIDKKYHNKIFKKFVHLNNVYSNNQTSTGLGLTITKELVKLHKGKISLESELKKGTTFRMEFKNIIV